VGWLPARRRGRMVTCRFPPGTARYVPTPQPQTASAGALVGAAAAGGDGGPGVQRARGGGGGRARAWRGRGSSLAPGLTERDAGGVVREAARGQVVPVAAAPRREKAAAPGPPRGLLECGLLECGLLGCGLLGCGLLGCGLLRRAQQGLRLGEPHGDALGLGLPGLRRGFGARIARRDELRVQAERYSGRNLRSPRSGSPGIGRWSCLVQITQQQKCKSELVAPLPGERAGSDPDLAAPLTLLLHGCAAARCADCNASGAPLRFAPLRFACAFVKTLSDVGLPPTTMAAPLLLARPPTKACTSDRLYGIRSYRRRLQPTGPPKACTVVGYCPRNQRQATPPTQPKAMYRRLGQAGGEQGRQAAGQQGREAAGQGGSRGWRQQRRQAASEGMQQGQQQGRQSARQAGSRGGGLQGKQAEGGASSLPPSLPTASNAAGLLYSAWRAPMPWVCYPHPPPRPHLSTLSGRSAPLKQFHLKPT
jgi:hypothetical protein